MKDRKKFKPKERSRGKCRENLSIPDAWRNHINEANQQTIEYIENWIQWSSWYQLKIPLWLTMTTIACLALSFYLMVPK